MLIVSMGDANLQDGSLIFAVKKAAFWGVSVRTHAHTPKCGGLSRKFLKNLQDIDFEKSDIAEQVMREIDHILPVVFA